MAAPTVATPAAVLQAATLLGIDTKQLHLFAAARAFVELPLPRYWARCVDAQQGTHYLDRRSNRVSSEHPQISQFRHLVSKLSLMVPADNEHRTCMEFQHPDGSKYVHDFRTGAAAPEQQPTNSSDPGSQTVSPAKHTTVVQAQPAAAEEEQVAASPKPGAEGQEAMQAPAEAAGVESNELPQPSHTAADATEAQLPSGQPTAAGTDSSNGEPKSSEQPAPDVASPVSAQEPDEVAAVETTERAAEQPTATAECGLQEDAGATPALVSLPADSEQPDPAKPSGQAKQPSISTWRPPPERMILPVSPALLEVFGLVNNAKPQMAGDAGVRYGVHKLRYYSWWYEDVESTDLTFRVNSNSVVGGGLQKRYVTLDYHLGSGTFSLSAVNEDQDLHMDNVPVFTKAGQQVEVWDLYTGATLIVLGRNLTLHKAELETGLWNERHAARLKQLKTELLGELQKYKPRAHSAAIKFDRGDRVGAGGLSLRHTVEQINTLTADLQQYRPAKAEQYRAKVQIKA